MPETPHTSAPTAPAAAPGTESPRVPTDPLAAQRAAVPEIGGPPGPEPTRYGDWEKQGRCIDF